MNSLDAYTQGIQLISPEILVVVAILLTSVWDLFFPKLKGYTPCFGILSLGGAFAILCQQFGEPQRAFNGLFTVDNLTVTFGLITCVVGIIVILMTMGYEHHFRQNRGEFYAILLTALVSVMFLAGSTDMINAAATMTRPTPAMPCRTASLVSRPWTYSSRIRLMRNTS